MMNTKDKHLQVAVASDDHYARMVSVLLTSLFEHNKVFDKITVHLLANRLAQSTVESIRRHVPADRGELIVHDVSDIQTKLGVEIPHTIAITAYSRLFLSTLLGDEVDKVLYMDVDALVADSLWDLWTMDMSGYEVAGVLDDVAPYAKAAVGMAPDAPYINSGFLLMNLKLWREEKMEQKILDFLLAHHGNVYHHDQGLINAVCERKRILQVNYNMVTNFFVFPFRSFHQHPFYTEQEMEEGKAHPVFVHFTAGVAGRPWMQHCKHPLRKLYWDMMEQAGYDVSSLDSDDRPFRLRFLSMLWYHCRPLYHLVIKLRTVVKE